MVLVVAMATAMAAAGCYNPTVADGKLACSSSSRCPDGFSCSAGRCWLRPPLGDASNPGDASQEAMSCPAPARAGCSPEGGDPCDPVCQTGGCQWCSQKCSVASSGGASVRVCAGAGAKTLGMSCTVSNSGTAAQHDDCVPGNVCLFPEVGAGFSYCFALCRASSDCAGGVACARRPIAPSLGGDAPTTRVCDPEYVKCDPASPTACCNPLAAGASGCPAGRFCYLVSPDLGTGDSRTVCDYATGSGIRTACESSRDCAERHVCAPTGFCQRVCNAANPCPNDRTCTSLGNQYGYCPL